jgi:outer membrane protein insertion porin family
MMILIKNLLILFFLFFSINGYAKNKWFIKNINFCGLHRVSKENISNYIKKYTGDTISQDNLNTVVYHLLKTGQFEDIKVIKFKDNLIFKIKEQSDIYHVNFSVNTAIPNSIIRKFLNNSNAKIGNELNSNYLHLFNNTFKKYYRSIGKHNVDIKSIFLIKFNKIACLKTLISERKCAVVDKVTISGNHVFSSKKIISLFQSCNKNNFWLFI